MRTASANLLLKKPLVSVILPFFNAQKTLERAILSIADQTYPHFECLLVDNNSVDGSAEIAQTFAARDKRFIYTTESRQGVVYASNHGSSQAKGLFVCRMDADDWSFPDRLERQADYLYRNAQIDVVAGQVEYMAHRPDTKGFARYVELINSIRETSEIENRRFIESPIINPSAMWRATTAEKLGMYREGSFPEDYELWLRWLDVGTQMVKIPHKVIRWYDSDSRLTRTDRRYSDKSFYKIKTGYLAKWLKKNNPHHPKVAVWGASRISRLRARLLEEEGIEIDFYIDISRKRQLDKPVVNYKEIPSAEEIFVLTYIRQANARQEICDFLSSRGFEEGKSFLLVS